MMSSNSQIQETFYDLVHDPNKRYHTFFEHYCSININQTTPIKSYIRSGKEIFRMANVYFNERDYFYAFVLYSRFLILFLEKLKTHMQYSTCSKHDLLMINKDLKSVALPRAEKLQKFIKETFEAEAKEYRLKNEKETNELSLSSSSSLQGPNDLSEDVKHKYNLINENELKLLQEKELNSLNDNNQVVNDRTSNDLNISKPSSNIPSVDRSSKPLLMNNKNLRTIIVPNDLTNKFLDIAQTNTQRNVETCGILAGRLNQNVFSLSHCIIPKQSGSADTCVTEEEQELFDTIDQLNLITLGWIHTHPTQTAFLSSIDLHTQYGYQIMMPEAIAIVCAPSHNENKIFMLKPTYGIKEIAECTKMGFHPHTTNPTLFEECDHVREDSSLKVQLIDLRIVSNRLI